MFAGQRATSFSAAQRRKRVFVGTADERSRFELDDSKVHLAQPLGKLRQRILEADNRLTAPLPQILCHPSLFRAYPELRDLPCRLSMLEKPVIRASASDVGDSITLGFGWQAAGSEIIKAQLHELQHIVQVVEGFHPGTSPLAEYERLCEERTEACSQALELAIRTSPYDRQHIEEDKEVQRLSLRFSLLSQRRLSATERQEFWTIAQQRYINCPGEKEAFEVEERAPLTLAQRLVNPPRISQPLRNTY